MSAFSGIFVDQIFESEYPKGNFFVYNCYAVDVVFINFVLNLTSNFTGLLLMSRKLSRHRSRKNNTMPVRKSNRFSNSLDYSKLEDRQLLATDLGLNLTAHTKATHSDVEDPNMVGDIGPTHYIESIYDRISIFNRNNGARTLNKTPNQFFVDIGATVTSTITNIQVIFDRFENRWLVLGEGSGGGNWLYLGISETSNPMQGWRSLRFVGDSQGIRHNGELNIAVDADALIITSRNTGTIVGIPLSSSIYTIPKANLYSGNPTLTNMSRFENLPPTLYGDFLRPAINFGVSDNRATILGSRGLNSIKTDITGVRNAGATLGLPVEIDFDPAELFVDLRNFGLGAKPPNARQDHANITIDPFVNTTGPKTNAPDVMNSPYIYDGGLWFVQGARVQYTSGVAHGIFWYEVDRNTNQLLQAGVVPPPAIGQPHEWDMYNPSFSINNFGLLQVNYTVSSRQNNVNPTAASSIAQHVNGLAIYDPIFDTIYYNNEEPGKESRNTQFERPQFIQNGLSVYNNNPTNISSWSWRASAGWDPTNYNRFWASTQWSNTQSRWSTQATQLIPVDMEPIITADDNDNFIVIRRKAGSPELMEIEIDGRVTDVLPYEPLGRVIINGFDGDDVFFIDYSNGDPIPKNGLELNGMRGANRLETNNPAGSYFLVNGNFRNIYNQATQGSGLYNNKTGFTGMTDLHGGPGPDTFEVTDVWNLNQPQQPYTRISQGYLPGSMVGNGGDDTFKFSELGAIGDSIDGGSGFNTLSFENRWAGGPKPEFGGRQDAPVIIQLIGPSENGGFDGFGPNDPMWVPAVVSPLGNDPGQDGDLFRNINFVRGGLFSFQDVRGTDDQAYVFVDDENSYYEAGGGRLGFFQINGISGSNFDDHFEAIRNTVDPLFLRGRGGNDLYEFGNNGNTAELRGLLFAEGGSGANIMRVDNRNGQAVDALILNNRFSGGLGEIGYSAVGGNFALTVWASEFADHIDLHSFFFTNTLDLYLLGGNDTMSIQDLSKAVINIYGGAGDDIFTIEKIQGIDLRNLSIIDSVNAERDRVQLRGTILDEVFTIGQSTFDDLNLVMIGIEWFGLETMNGNDIINLTGFDFEFYVNTGNGNNIINISSNAPTNTGHTNGFSKPITIETGNGRNELRVSNQSGSGRNVQIHNNQIVGMLDAPIFFDSGAGRFDLASGIGGITLWGSNTGNDTFTVLGLNVDDSLRIFGGGGNDAFVVAANALGSIELDGGAGTDSFAVNLVNSTSTSRAVRVRDDATGSLTVNGTAGTDVMSLVSGSLSRGNQTVQLLTSINDYNIFGLGGNDTISINWSTGVAEMNVMGGDGNDTISLNVTQPTTFATILGGNGDDSLNIGPNVSGNVLVDGQNGNDRTWVRFQNSGNRQVDARDTGTTGSNQDVLFVVGSAGNDQIELRSNVVNRQDQRVQYDANSNRLIVQGLSGDDTIDVYGSVAATTQVQGGTGNDRVNVFSTTGATQLTLDGNDGDDQFLVVRTAVETNTILRGGGGDDRFNIGSTFEENSGNLGLMRGRIKVEGNTSTPGGEDRLYINDFNVNVPYNYLVTPTAVRGFAGPNNVPRPQFAGIFFDGTMEFVRLDGTIAPNWFSVFPSQNTRFYLDGNLPSPLVGAGDTVFLNVSPGDGHQLTITDAPRGRGFWSFTNGNQEVRFDGIETTLTGGGGGFTGLMPPLNPSNGEDEGGSGGGFMFFAPSVVGVENSDVGFDSLAGSITLDDSLGLWDETSLASSDLDLAIALIGDDLNLEV